MPEGHTIHRLARDHSKPFEGQTVVSTSPQGRFTEGAERLNGQRVDRVFAHGKHLFYQFSSSQHGPLYCHVHLGLFGRFKKIKAPFGDPKPTVRWRLTTRTAGFDLTGPNYCELLDELAVRRLRNRLGPDPLASTDQGEAFAANMAKTRRAIGAVLLDQAMVSGVGNIYRCELLWAHGLSPTQRACDVDSKEITALWTTMRRWLKIGVETNKIITTLDDDERPAKALTRSEQVRIYKKEVCPKCENPISIKSIAQRKLYFCPQCQRESD
ncbi:MAG: DNA-formamidopyrimidine glycosylase family protein [Myxococcota bacterium]|nr:DNA-formamidopyrimidine glycosylase family protein [Myxococcota bacterium]